MPGDSWGAAIVNGIENSRIFLLIFSAESNDSPQVLREVERAISKDIILIPFIIDEVKPSKAMEYYISSTHWLEASKSNLDENISQLVKIVKNAITPGFDDEEEINQDVSPSKELKNMTNGLETTDQKADKKLFNINRFNRKTMYFGAVIIFLIVIGVLFTQYNFKNNYENAEISFDYPSTWKQTNDVKSLHLDENINLSSVATFGDPSSYTENTYYTAIGIFRSNYYSNITGTSMYQRYRNYRENQIFSEKNITVNNNLPAYEFIRNGIINDRNVTIKDVLFVSNGYIYIIHATSLNVDFNNNINNFDNVINSVKLI